MRQKHAKAAEPRTRRHEPLTEGMQKKGTRRNFTRTEVAHIKKRYRKLTAEGRNNWQISKEIADSMGRTAGCVENKIRKLIRRGELGENPNQRKAAVARRFTEPEIAYIKKRYGELAAEGMKNSEISKEIADSMGRTAGTIKCKIRNLIRKGELGQNPNQIRPRGFLSEMSDDEFVAYVKDIAEKRGITTRRGFRKADSNIIRVLYERGLTERVLGRSLRKKSERKEFTAAEIRHIKKRYRELVSEGRNNMEIARGIGNEMGRKASSINCRIIHLIREGELGKNPNAAVARRFTESEIAYIKKRYRELVSEGRNNMEIARGIADEMGRKVGGIEAKIKKLIREGNLAENPNAAVARRFTESEIAYIKKRYGELVTEGRNNWQIAREIANSMNRSTNSIFDKIRRLIKRGEIGKNPNQKEMRERGFFSEMSDVELIEYAKKIITDNKISSRMELDEKDSGLYATLWKRRLIDRVFSEIEPELAQSQHEQLLSDIRECFDAYTGDAP